MIQAEQIKALMRFIRLMPEELRGIRRWTHYVELPLEERETVETHELSTTWLGFAMLSLERTFGKYQLNEMRILGACALHDTGEGQVGDIRYNVKIDPRVRDHLRAIEDEYVGMQFQGFPNVIREAFLDAYAVEDEGGKTGEENITIDGEFFEAIERIGYIIFAVYQVKTKKRLSFRKVFRNQHEHLLRLGEKFESARICYEPYRQYVADELEALRRFEAADDAD